MPNKPRGPWPIGHSGPIPQPGNPRPRHAGTGRGSVQPGANNPQGQAPGPDIADQETLRQARPTQELTQKAYTTQDLNGPPTHIMSAAEHAQHGKTQYDKKAEDTQEEKSKKSTFTERLERAQKTARLAAQTRTDVETLAKKPGALSGLGRRIPKTPTQWAPSPSMVLVLGGGLIFLNFLTITNPSSIWRSIWVLNPGTRSPATGGIRWTEFSLATAFVIVLFIIASLSPGMSRAAVLFLLGIWAVFILFKGPSVINLIGTGAHR